jgi:hypothetical protein
MSGVNSVLFNTNGLGAGYADALEPPQQQNRNTNIYSVLTSYRSYKAGRTDDLEEQVATMRTIAGTAAASTRRV